MRVLYFAIIPTVILIMDVVFLFITLTKLLEIPGNRKLLRLYPNQEKEKKKKGDKVILLVLVTLIVVINIAYFVK